MKDVPIKDINQARRFVLSQGGVVIQHNPNYFDYMIDNKFAYIEFENERVSISSNVKPSKGTGSGYVWKRGFFDEIKGSDLIQALNYTFEPDRVKFYKDLDDFMENYFFKDKAKIIDGRKMRQ